MRLSGGLGRLIFTPNLNRLTCVVSLEATNTWATRANIADSGPDVGRPKISPEFGNRRKLDPKDIRTTQTFASVGMLVAAFFAQAKSKAQFGFALRCA